MGTIYSLVVEADNCGTTTLLFYTEAERDAKAREYVTEEWHAGLGDMPLDTWEAFNRLHEGWNDCDLYLWADSHQIDPAKLEA